MKNYDCIFLDRDGTLNSDSGYISSLNDFQFYPFTIPAMSKMNKAGNQFCIVTNQSGVSRGIIQLDDLIEINDYIKEQFKKNQITLLDIYFAIDHPDNASDRRKPGPGMFLEAESNHNLNLMNCLIIGDSINDIRAGEMLFMDTMLVLTGNGKETLKNLSNYEMPTYIVNDLSQGAEIICR